MKRKIALGLTIFAVLLVILDACSIPTDAPSVLGETTIARTKEDSFAELPLEKEDVLKSFAADPQILDYNIARKIALIEFLAMGMDQDMGWEGNKLSKVPVVVYGFDNKPKYYDFIVLDAEKQMVGTLTVYARRTATTSIRGMSSGVKDYRATLSKAGGADVSLFEDWKGGSYLGIRGKAGETPVGVINADTGDAAEGVTEIEDAEIIDALMAEDFPALLTIDASTIDLPTDDPLYETVQQSIAEQVANAKTPEEIENALRTSLREKNEYTEAFWNALSEYLPDIERITDEEEVIDASGKGFFSSLISAIVHKVVTLFTGVDQSRYYIDKYTNYTGTEYLGTNNASDRYCGPWACGYLMWIKENQTGNKYSAFYNLAPTFGEFRFLNFVLRAFGRPMTPTEMSWSLPAVSGGRIWFAKTWLFNNSAAYDYIKLTKKPAIRLCAASNGGGLHYTVAVGTRRTGSIFAETFYFLQHDNHDHGENYFGDGKKLNKRDYNNEYKTVEWWNPWFLVVD